MDLVNDLVLNASIDERFAFKETKNDLNPTILTATAIMCVGDINRACFSVAFGETRGLVLSGLGPS